MEVVGGLELFVVLAVRVSTLKRERIKECRLKGRRGGFRVSPLFGRHPVTCGVY